MSHIRNHHHHPNYRKALSYNDNGIDCMRQGDYSGAISSFRMALIIMKEAISHDDSDNRKDNTTNTTNTTTTKTKIFMATPPQPQPPPQQQQQHRGPTTATTSTTSTTVTMTPTSATKVIVGSDNEEEKIMVMSSDTQMMMMMTSTTDSVGCDNNNAQNKRWLPIRVDPPTIDRTLLLRHDEDDDNNENDLVWERTTAILLYNIGLCTIMKTTTTTCDDIITLSSCQSSANRLFGLAQDLIRRNVTKLENNHLDESTIPVWYGLHQIEMMILSATIIMHQDMMTSPPWWLWHRTWHVQGVLISHRHLVSFLSTVNTTNPNIPPCA